MNGEFIIEVSPGKATIKSKSGKILVSCESVGTITINLSNSEPSRDVFINEHMRGNREFLSTGNLTGDPIFIPRKW